VRSSPETGSSITLVAVYIQVYQLTGSAAAVGAIGLVQLVPLMIGSLFGGPFIDRHDRRRLLQIAQIAQAGGSVLLLIGALMDSTPVAVVYLGAAIIAGVSGFALATRAAMTPNLVPRDRLPSALALNQVMYQIALIVGPAVGGVIVGSAGLAWAYAIDVVSFGATITTVAMMRPHPPVRDEAPDAPELSGWQRLADGFRFLRGRRVLQSTFIVDLIAMIFGMPRALFPILAVVQFHGGAEEVGVLFSAVSLGALVSALTSGWVHRVRRQNWRSSPVTLWGSAIAAFGLRRSHPGGRVLLWRRGGCQRSFDPRSCRTRFRTTCRWFRNQHRVVVAVSGTSKRALLPRRSARRSRWYPAGVLCVVGVGCSQLLRPEFAVSAR
jgi:MFS family permease